MNLRELAYTILFILVCNVVNVIKKGLLITKAELFKKKRLMYDTVHCESYAMTIFC